ncbi:sulfite exporter TauE/SafE family protein [Fructilactobacillus fructivorans]|nr:sulfite exporter TauE/SafE family protein [Fructilactobacillus fructivorans]KID41625.1 hypothetical protein LfDm3_0867 [Fructilactobacillus fructivorans]KRK57790.1 integral membrane protein [Fructilactobacillus fructivorans]KRN40668.1 integral membrane protein [Fructilactobacillus fructivorans]KRN43208.1 integral membrane protein [Fructilactobacillus fructivorans]
MLKLIFLVVAGVISGVLESTVGLASLVAYPAMLLAGFAPIVANVTNTVGFAFSDSSAILASQKELKGQSKIIMKVIVFAGIGTIIGSLILLNSSNKSFENVAPIIIMISGILMLLPKSQRQLTETHMTWFGKIITAIALVLVGMYLGYFGAGGGVMLIAILLRAVNQPYAICNAIRNFVSLILNWISAVIFMFTMPINWVALIAITIGLLVGGYIGPSIVRHIPSKIMKYGVGIGAVVLAICLGIKTY